MPSAGRDTTSSNVFLTLDGVKCGPVRSVAGGAVSADVIVESPNGGFAKKHVAGPRYEPFTIGVGLELAKQVHDWVTDFWNGNVQQKTGSLVTADFKLDAKSEREFVDALLVGTTLPPLDAAAKEPAFFSLTVAPEFTRTKKASGKVEGPAAAKSKQWLRSGFRLQIDGLDCSKISKIAPIAVKREPTVSTDPFAFDSGPGPLQFSDLAVTLGEVTAKTWLDWHDDFVVKGNNDDSRERTGTILLLAPDQKTELGRVKLFGLGIYRIAREPDVGGSQQSSLTAQLYCQRMELQVKAP
jgi:hypothetical protein